MFRTYVIDTWCIRQIVTTVTTAPGDKKKPTWPMAERQNWTWLPEVGFSPCRALVGVLPLKNLPICSGNLPPHPHHWFCLLSTSLLLIRAYTNFRPHTIFVSKQKVFGDFYFFVSVEGASFHGDNMVQCVTTAVVMRRGHSILFQERGDTFITGGFASRLMDTSV